MSWIARVSEGAAVFLAVCMGWTMPASAGDWAVTTHIGETVEANDNPQLVPKSPGGDVGSITNLTLQAIDELPTLRWETDVDLGFQKYWGPGALGSYDGVRGDVRTAIDKATELTNYHAAFLFQDQPASVSEVTDSGITNANTSRVTYSGNGGLQHQLNDLNALGLTVSGTSVNFTSDNGGLTPFTDVSTTQSWIHNVNPRTDLTGALSTEWYAADDVANTNSVIERATGQIDTQLTERLKFMGRAGVGVVNTTGRSQPSDTSANFVANGALTYLLKNTTLSALASHNLVPSSLGQIQENSTVGLTVGHQINEWSSMFLSGLYLNQLPSTSGVQNNNDRQAVVLSVSYERNLIRDWDLKLTYSFTQQDNGDRFFESFIDGGSAQSNAVFVTVTRNITLLPN
jgi:hypothetical protein